MKKKVLVLGLILMLLLTACDKTKEINDYINKLNLAEDDYFNKASYDEESKTISIDMYSHNKIDDIKELEEDIKNVSAEIKDIAGDGYTVKLAYKRFEDDPIIVIKDNEITVNKLKDIMKSSKKMRKK